MCVGGEHTFENPSLGGTNPDEIEVGVRPGITEAGVKPGKAEVGVNPGKGLSKKEGMLLKIKRERESFTGTSAMQNVTTTSEYIHMMGHGYVGLPERWASTANSISFAR